MTLAMVWLLPVPGGPWMTRAGALRAWATASAWQGSACATGNSVAKEAACERSVRSVGSG